MVERVPLKAEDEFGSKHLPSYSAYCFSTAKCACVVMYWEEMVIRDAHMLLFTAFF